jgi:hypothetical protein
MMKSWLFLFVLFAFTSCEKDISFTLDQAKTTLTVDASIETGQPPVVVLTNSLPFYAQIDSVTFANVFARNALVVVSNGTLTHKLKEYKRTLPGGYINYYYSIDSSSLATAFVGQFNKKYSLHIEFDGKQYDAVTSIPASSNYPDSVWFKPAPQNPDTTQMAMYIRSTDPPGRGNYYRYFTRRNRSAFLPGENVFDDQVIDGTTYEILLPQGIDRNRRLSMDDNFYTRGDSVALKFCAIDKASYTFWNTWEFAFQSIGNPFAQPNKVLGNISNGALGIFCGYGCTTRTFKTR